ncbi:MAG: ABC transporter ATP-binding protein [Bacilli bacterium]|jgi:ABC-2 type transport system ATP-binding protein|nr:ABC transporter ATP-binding protein [Bacilli bacterium]
MTNGDIVVQTKGLTKRYGSTLALNNVNITVRRGEIYGFVGRNGAGKTTLIRVLTGIANPTAGSFMLLGAETKAEQKEARQHLAAMVETPALYMNMTAHDNLRTTLILKGIKDESLIVSRLEEVGLEDVIYSSKKAKDFSLGMKQRLGIAMSLLGDPELLILDEPTNGLDPEGIREMRELLVNINKTRNITMIISSHILGELSKLATTFGFIDKGKIINEISSEDLFNKVSKSVVIKTDDNIKALQIINEKYPGKVSKDDNGSLHIVGVDNSSEIVKLLVQSDINVLNFREQENGLEDYFIELIGGNHRG